MSEKLKVFLCHASESKPVVKELFDRLTADGFDPWLDSERLLPGMDWDLEIQEAMRASDVVIVCLSTISVAKEGYVQKELKYAREIQKEKPDGTIFLIPLQLEKYDIPFRLQEIQWGKYFETEGYDKVTQSLKVRANQLGRVIVKDFFHALPIGSHLPFPRNALFTGREQDLEKLKVVLTSKSEAVTFTVISQTISGMGGIGKTQLAVEFAYRYGYLFKGVHWLDLRDTTALDNQIALSGEKMNFRYWPKEQPEQVALTLRTWQTDGPRLLILDNFENMQAAGQILACFQNQNLRLLITSRHSDWPTTLGLRPLPLDVFSDDEGIAFLKKYTQDRFADNEIKKLAVRLGELPLALELAGRYLEKHTRLSIDEYLSKIAEALEHPSMRGFRKDLPNPTGHELDLLATFALSWQQVQYEVARNLFMLAGYCAPNTTIPYEIFENSLSIDEEICDEAITHVVGLGLMKENISLHPLLAEYARLLDQDKTQLRNLAKSLKEVVKNKNIESDKSGNLSIFSPLTPHLQIIAEKTEEFKIEGAAYLWNDLGYHIRKLAYYAGAMAAFERALRIDESTLGPDHPDVARDVNNIGTVLCDLGDLQGAKTAHERALKIREAAFGPDHPDVASDVSNLGTVLRDLGDLQGAKTAFERALKIDEAAFGPDHPDVARDVNNLGGVLHDLGDLQGAKTAHERALKINEAAFGPDHPDVARDVNNLGGVLRDLGDLQGAKTAFERALKIHEAAFGPDHPDVARDVNNIGIVLRDLGDLQGAKTAHERALKIDEAAFGPDHPDVARDVNNLGGVLRDLGDLQGAKTALERALPIFKQTYGLTFETGELLNNLGLVTVELGNTSGINYLRQAQIILLKALPHSHPLRKQLEQNIQMANMMIKNPAVFNGRRRRH
jgi:tetratricopeptide (TPR) repeat protein